MISAFSTDDKPTVSIGSVPQLAIDLFSYRCHREKASSWLKIGYLESEHVHPVAGVEEKPLAEDSERDLCLALEGIIHSSLSLFEAEH